MARDLKYGRVTVERDPDFAEDEIVVVFRARDRLLLELLDYYRDLCRRENAEKEFLILLKREINATQRWQQDNTNLIQLPDHLNLPQLDV